MISKKQEKLIRALRQKKYRNIYKLFLVEGEKLVEEAIRSDFEIELLISVKGKELAYHNLGASIEVSEREMKQLSNFSTPPGTMALVKQKAILLKPNANLVLVLENVRDPGNLGTILRSADAFGVDFVYCSNETVDAYSPKVVQASMGSIFNIPIVYGELSDFINQNRRFNFYGLQLDGDNIYQVELQQPAALLMGNESRGLSEKIKSHVNMALKIPIVGKAESLNVSMATTVVLAEFSRRFA